MDAWVSKNKLSDTCQIIRLYIDDEINIFRLDEDFFIETFVFL